MALSGTLDTFALPDVLRLLSSTSKTGRLRVSGDRGSGSVWVAAGEVVGTELTTAATHRPSNAEVMFGLLRFVEGSFTFEADSLAANPGAPESLEPILGSAENMLVEWRAIEEVIPSLDLWVGLNPDLSGPEVAIDQIRWRGIASIGSGAQVGAVMAELEMNEIDSCRLIKELMEIGLVEFIDEPAGLPAPTSFEPEPVLDVADEPAFQDAGIHDTAVIEEPFEAALDAPDEEISFDENLGEPEALLGEFDAGDGSAFGETETPFGEASLDDAPSFDNSFIPPDGVSPGTEPSLAALASSQDGIDPLLSAGDPLETMGDDMFGASSGGSAADEELDPAEMARQLANLSPKAAKAVAAAAKATTDAERDAALAAVEAEDDSVNRGLLLKFLGSVDS